MNNGGLRVNGLGVMGRRVGSGSLSRGSGTPTPDTVSRHANSIILFDCSKGEIFTPTKGMKTFQRKLKSKKQSKINEPAGKSYQVKINKDDLSEESLTGVRTVIMASPQNKIEPSEIKALKSFVSEGGSLLILGQEGGESKPNQQISKLTSEFGITMNNDSVVRTAYRADFFHPKEVYIARASLTPEIDQYAGKTAAGTSEFPLDDQDENEEEENGNGGLLDLVYPFGCTLAIDRPATPIITSGKMSFPANRPLGAACRLNNGLVVVFGSARTFTDKYINREDNQAFLDGVISMILSDDTKLGSVEMDRPEFKEPVQVPDMEALAERLRCCLQEPEELPTDFSRMFDLKLFGYNTDMVPETIALYERLNVKHEPLSNIPPQFEVPLPPLQPAVFLPCMRDLPPPALDLFDLDQEFSGETVQLAQLTNKCQDKDLDYYVINAGNILSVTSKVDTGGKQLTAKHILEYIFKELVNYKKMDSDAPFRETKSGNSLVSPSPKSEQRGDFIKSQTASAGSQRSSVKAAEGKEYNPDYPLAGGDEKLPQ
mmetsp:Transcript_20564/g.38674  ORF Transcript_20564/g.38674 Transcript_20564/m.38674 type:complete len:543 (-) Transcript_20564:146-1774(-)|eukprot:CAMPEP_0170173068 /NCGR_PEP_ID=MMETSP0040_2-20121228/6340_1 /TAXON_ID=641309 /ORGANISM="Lotharella oceanica, Strain CCMP622" /LENGTH=542 /DNA_ID=CAMNT_0010414063 /DNA_START=99 /DNA_END=1727 /DNA_ORIENTATION=+